MLHRKIIELVRTEADKQLSQAIASSSKSFSEEDQDTGLRDDSNEVERLVYDQDVIAETIMAELRFTLIDAGAILAERLGDPNLAIDLITREAQTILDMDNDGSLASSLKPTE